MLAYAYVEECWDEKVEKTQLTLWNNHRGNIP